MQSLDSRRIILFCSFVAMALLAVAFYTAPVSAEPDSSLPAQALPTREKPPPTKKPSKPDKPADKPTATPVPTAVPPTLTPTLAPTSTPRPTPTPTSVTIVDTEFPDRAIVPPPSGQVRLTFEQLGHGAITLSPDTPDHQYRVDLPGNFEVSSTGNYLGLTTSHFPQALENPAALEIDVNGRLVFSLALSEVNAISNQARIDLPPGLLRAGTNLIAVHLDTGSACKEPGSIVNLVISENSGLHFSYQQVSYPTDLSSYPLPFAEKSLIRIPVTMVLPDIPTERDLAAAMSLAAGLGRKSGGEIDLRAIVARDFDPSIHQHDHLIVLGRTDKNALYADLDLPLSLDDGAIESDEGILQEIVSPWDEFRLVLVVSGRESSGLAKASHTLNQETGRVGLRGPTATVTQFRPLVDTEALPIRTIPPTATTLAAFGYSDQTAYGAKPQIFGYEFQLPRGWQLEGSPRLVLRLSHAAILDPIESVLDVRLNDRPVGGAFLDESNATKGELALFLPERLLKAGSNRLQIGIEMNLPGRDRCQVLTDERAWTTISSESELYIPYLVADLAPDLSTLPHPFSRPSGLDETLFVPPDAPDEATLNYLIQLAAHLGTSTYTEYWPIDVTYAPQDTLSGDSQGAWQDRHVILVGRPTANAVLDEVNDYLPQPFVEDGDVPAPSTAEGAAPRLPASEDLGLLQIVFSPWNPDYALLVISGTSDEGVHLAAQALMEPVHRLEGNLAFIEPAPSSAPGELGRINTYTIDVQPPVPPEETATVEASEVQTEATLEIVAAKRIDILLAERWW